MSNALDLIDFESESVNVEEFSRTKAGLAELRERFSNFPDPFLCKDNYDFVHNGVRELTKLRTTVEKKRKELKKPFVDAGRIIDAEAKGIIESLQELEQPMKDAKLAVDEKEKREKEERIARLQKRIDDIKQLEKEARGKTSEGIIELIEHVENVDPADFYDLREEAMRVRNEVLDNLGAALSERKEYERTAAQREKEKKAREEAERKAQFQERINKAKMLPVDHFNSPTEKIERVIKSLEDNVYTEDEWGEFRDEAEQAGNQALGQLKAMLEQKRQLEALTPKQEEKQEVETEVEEENEPSPEQEVQAEAPKPPQTLEYALLVWRKTFNIKEDAWNELEAILDEFEV